MATEQMDGGRALIRALENEGVEYIFGIPGEENLDFLESLRNSKIKFWILVSKYVNLRNSRWLTLL